ncbi:hypothetical protein NQ314_011248 [Rhamnusium bicolor]|uniref:PiggyBac transposable element-derived protein domain-containing protein n=1 Tax=Rhamnusium bicolor TaxID=1586634 RepID=A0AAV8XJ44_9CUCU|nr:hypothetical protein NQ314_011248 [Rhamnusium bicolor]
MSNDEGASHGIPPNDLENLIDKRELEIFKIFLDDELIELMVRETNRYAEQVLIEKINDESITCNSRLNDWVETNAVEIRSELYNSPARKFMSRNKFEILLRMWHFADNAACPPGDRLHKVQILISYLVSKYQKFYIPSETVCIDETMVPFRLYVNGGYTCNMKIYCGKESENDGVSVADKVVLGLMNNLLDSGRTLFTDNWYTSVGLVRKLATRGTHLVGTLRSNRKYNPKNVITASLNQGQIFGMESDDGITILKWKDKRDVLMLSTKHGIETTNIGQRQKLVAIIDYNAAKSFIDVSDQRASYSSAVRKALKWYRKVAVEALLRTTIVNSLFLYNKINGKKTSIIKFRKNLCSQLLHYSQPANVGNIARPPSNTHKLEVA